MAARSSDQGIKLFEIPDLRAQLREIAERKPRWGYRRAHGYLRESGWPVNRKRVQRLWRE
ncbi:MAG: HTH-like domain [Conexibacter sp.]|nr:HTH-like domain [Conexibacter sp.]